MKITAQAETSFVKGGRAMEDRAIALATRLHEGQKRKDGSDYIAHPLRVMAAFADVPGHEGVILRTAAVLHDVVEDTPATVEEITANFGPEVSEVVDLLTRRGRNGEGETYADYVVRLAENERARRVKIADTEDNLRDVDLLPDKAEAKGLRRRYEWTLGVLR